jgi:cyclic-di-GMP-binding protein
MPSFDIVSKIAQHELVNAIDQANREVKTRFDFRDTNSHFELKEKIITLYTGSEFQLKQMTDILQSKLSKRSIDLRTLNYKKPEINLKDARQEVEVQQGLSQELAKKINQLIKNTQLKVQTAIQGEQIRVTGKKKDDLQEVISFLKGQKLELPLQFENYRD